MSDALLLPGVVDVITAKDIPGKKTRMLSGYDEEILAQTQVKITGEMDRVDMSPPLSEYLRQFGNDWVSI